MPGISEHQFKMPENQLCQKQRISTNDYTDISFFLQAMALSVD
jgi:hypothetical protein